MTLLAAALRLYGLEAYPAGLNVDEAAEGLMALQILDGARPVFFSAYTGQEAGFMYLVAAAITALGRSILAVRIPAALAGVAFVPFLALFARRAIGPNGALLAAATAAGAPWLLHLNRIGFRANVLPLVLVVWGWLFLRALDETQTQQNAFKQQFVSARWLAAGVALGLTAYTYLAARVVPLLVLLFISYLILVHRRLARRAAAGLALMLLSAAVLALPLALHFLAVPSDWSARTGQIWACADVPEASACLARLADHGVRTLGMAAFAGDAKSFYNQGAASAVWWPLGLLFYAGLALALWRWRSYKHALLVLWWCVMILPGVLSSESPSFIRTLGAAPAMMTLIGLPVSLLEGKRLSSARGRRLLGWAAAGLGVLVMVQAVTSASNYFRVWAVDPERYYDYNAYAVDTARAAAETPADVELLISEEYNRHATYLYLEPRTAAARWFDARVGWPEGTPGRPSIYFLPYTTPVDGRFVAPFITGGAGHDAVNPVGQYSYTRIAFPPGAASPPTTTALNTLESLQLEGATIDDGGVGQPVRVTLHWRVDHPDQRELRSFVHLVDAAGNVVAQQDSLGYPASEWRSGDRFATFATLVPPGAGTYRILVGLYDVASGQRLSASGAGATGDSVTLPTKIQRSE